MEYAKLDQMCLLPASYKCKWYIQGWRGLVNIADPKRERERGLLKNAHEYAAPHRRRVAFERLVLDGVVRGPVQRQIHEQRR